MARTYDYTKRKRSLTFEECPKCGRIGKAMRWIMPNGNVMLRITHKEIRRDWIHQILDSCENEIELK